MKNKKVDISIVIPLFNEQDNIDILFTRLINNLQQLCSNYEIIFIDDGSNDESLEKIKAISAKDENVLGIALSRNFGHQIALMAGLEHSTGEVVITMDADMQHPPEIIPELYKKYQQGFDIINTIRESTEDSGFMKNITSHYFYKIINWLSDIHIEPASADFRLMNRKTVNAFLELKEKDRFTRGLISWMGFKQATIPYAAPPRNHGKTKYTFRKMLHFGIDGITSFSAKPLRISFYSGLIVSCIGLVYAVYAIIENLLGKTVQGWTSILVSVLIIGGIQLISIGIIGEYLARVFNESKKRPLYFVKEYTAKEVDLHFQLATGSLQTDGERTFEADNEQ